MGQFDSIDMSRYETLEMERAEQVATIELLPSEEWDGHDLHWELGQLLSELRGDLSVRVVVVTGKYDDFYLSPPAENFGTPGESTLDDETFKRDIHPPGVFKMMTGMIRTHQEMTEMEKPIVAKVNGDAKGFGTSVVWSCDLIVAEEDSEIVDIHMDMGETQDDGRRYGPSYGIAPGDGGAALLPLHMPPAKAKEYLMLGKTYTGSELAEQGFINEAVPPAELDDTVDELVERLLERSAFSLAWTKRMANRHIAEQLNRVSDGAAAYEFLKFSQVALFDEDPKQLEYEFGAGSEPN
jgi:enoyl-CoA hydratase